uniref:FGGY_C domain-containing protein n=1 Tax=Macrostomum lignano TaxID=282301 RepID=A0A1I8G5R9_9PLAT
RVRQVPAVLVNAGSSVGMCIVNESGEAVRLSLSFFSCKTLAGLASLLLGTADFEEIVRLAEAGDRGNVDLKIDELTAEDPLHPFGAYDGDIPLVHLGKIANASVTAAKREDVARSLVSLFCFNLFSTILSFASDAQVNNVYLGGSCFRHSLFRREFENARSFRLHRAGFNHHFLKVGAQVGSIGALVSANELVPIVLKFSVA